MNEHGPFEQRLRRQPLRPVPSAWREEILAQARATADARQRDVAAQTVSADQAALIAGWRLLFARLPLAWASLAALWIALIGLNLAMPSPMVRMAEPGASSAQMELLAALDVQPAGYEPLSDQPAPAPQALPAPKHSEVPLRPRSERRRSLDFGEVGSDSVLNNLA